MSNHHRDSEAIRQVAEHWRTGWLTGNADALLELFADSPVLMPQGQPTIHGKNAIRSIYKALLSEVTIQSEGTLMEVEASGDLGFFWSTYKLVAVPKAGGANMESEGKSLFILKRQPDGNWKISHLIDNSSR